MKRHILISLVISLLLGACAAPGGVVLDAKERDKLSVKMVNLSAAVEDYFGDSIETSIDTVPNILQKATRRNPSVLPPEFEAYLVKIQYQNPYGVLLLCSKDGKQAIMEDAGCSARLDRQVTDAAPCTFTLHVVRNCEVEGADPQ